MPTDEKDNPIRPETPSDISASKRWSDVWTFKNRVIGIDVPAIESSGVGAAKSAENSNVAKQVGVAHEAEGLADVIENKDPHK